MQYLSVCSGIEAATVAWHPLGWSPVAFSEVEPFPSAVLAHHYPNTPNLGDMTKIKDSPIIANAELLVGGTPCQSFSICGLRGSLGDERGNLALEFVRLADAIDDVRRRREKGSAWIVWENVPGVFSTKDNAFGCFLGGLVGSESPITPSGKWTSSGVAVGPKRIAAWRVLDAKYFGVPQRRRRVFVVANGRDKGFACADALLPVTEGLRWHNPQGQQAKEVIGTVTTRTGRSNDNYISEQGFLTLREGRPAWVTPDECEALMGLPVGYTNIEYNGKPTNDGNRYKAIGNSFAVPVIRWIGERIMLVDGITD